MRPFYIILAIAVAGSWAIDSYNYQRPSNPLELSSSQSQPTGISQPFLGLNQGSVLSQGPEISQGYNYQSPFSNSQSLGGNDFPGSSSSLSSSSSLPLSLGGNGLSSIGSNGLGGLSSSNGLGGNGLSSIGGNGLGGNGLGSNGFNPGLNFDSGVSPSSGINSFSNGNQFLNDAPQQKHVYVYVAPPEPQAETKQIFVPSQAANHKIIFIKAPTQSIARTQVIPLGPKEEKTLVYVLVKKPEEAEINVRAPPPAHAAKPEVYFIKYNTKKEPGNIGGIGIGGGPGGIGIGGGQGGIGIGGPSGISNGFGGSNNGLPIVEDARRGRGRNGFDPSTSGSNLVGVSPVYGPSN